MQPSNNNTDTKVVIYQLDETGKPLFLNTIPRRHSTRYRYPPFFIALISILELVVFVYYGFRSEESISTLGPVPFRSKLIYDPYRRYEVWRFFTYCLIHAGFLHIIFNLLVQIVIGMPLESVHKFNAVFIIYFGGVLGGALGNSVLDPHSYLAGASGGCYALVAAHLSDLIINLQEYKAGCIRLIALVTAISLDFGTSIFERHYGTRDLAYRTSYGGHVAGFVSGLLLGLYVLKNFKVRNWEVKLANFCICLYIALIVAAIGINFFCSDYFPLPDRNQLIWTQNPFLRQREV